MKYFLLALLPLFFIGCDKKTLPPAPLSMTYMSPYDSTLVVYFNKNENGNFLCLLKDGSTVKETRIPVYKKDVDLGYGETVSYVSSPENVFFLKNRIIVVQHSSEGKFSAFDYFTGIKLLISKSNKILSNN